MRILHVVADHSPRSGGVFRSIEDLGEGMVERGHDVRVVCTGEAMVEEGRLRRTAYPVGFPRGLYASPGLLKHLEGHVDEADVVHVHSQWTVPVWWGSQMAARLGKPLVHSPHGALSPASLAHHAWRKRMVSVLDRRVLRRADRIVADSGLEADWIRQWCPADAKRVRIIPPVLKAPVERERAEGVKGGPKRVLFVGRPHPMKGIDLLLEAWRRVRAQSDTKEWELALTAPDSVPWASGDDSSVRWVGELSPEACRRAIGEADVLVLPSRSECFGLAVAEALFQGVPAITTTATPWEGILKAESGSAGWVVEPLVDSLSEALLEAMSMASEELREMGRRGKQLMRERFSDGETLRAWETLYQDVVDRSV